MIRRQRLFFALVVLAALHLPILFAGFFAPFDPAEQHRDHSFAPPSLRAGGARFVLGTDRYGRDQLSRVLHGGRVSLGSGIAAASLALLAGSFLGVLAGFHGGWLDDVIMRAAEIMLAIPWLYLLLAVRAFLPLDLPPMSMIAIVTVILGAIGWARPARLVRGVVLSARERDFVQAAVSFGASPAFVLRRHIVPQTYGLLLVQAMLLVPQYMLAEVTLSFLGLGVSEPAPSWGAMLSVLQQPAALQSYWWLIAPAVVMIIFFLAYHYLAEVLRERVRLAS